MITATFIGWISEYLVIEILDNMLWAMAIDELY